MPRPPTLPVRTDRLALRAHELEDLDDLLSYYMRPDVTRYLPWEPWTRDFGVEQLALRLGRRHIGSLQDILGLVVTHDDEVIGDVVMWPLDEALRTAEIGWVLHPDHTGRGFATEAVQAMLGIAFDHYGMHRVMARLDARNGPSAALCSRVGMTHEASLRKATWAKGEWVDTWMFAILDEEWPQHRPSS